jgi:hypothetical protein
MLQGHCICGSSHTLSSEHCAFDPRLYDILSIAWLLCLDGVGRWLERLALATSRRPKLLRAWREYKLTNSAWLKQ